MPVSAQPQPLPAAPAPPPSPSIEQLIGEFTAIAACLFAQGLGDCVRSGRLVPMSAETRQQGGKVMAALIELREHTAGKLDFDHMAQVRGARVLQEWWGSNVSAAMVDDLVRAVLDILADIVRQRLHSVLGLCSGHNPKFLQLIASIYYRRGALDALGPKPKTHPAAPPAAMKA